jgi:hypothetical protein
MLHLTNVSILILLAVILFQDFKQREISWFLIPLLFIAFIIKALFIITLTDLIKNTFVNIGFICIQLLVLTIYMSVKNKKITNIVNSHLGLGDVLFFFVICVAFSPVSFIVFYLVSLLFTLLGSMIYRVNSKTTNQEIPLAGAMSGGLIVLILANFYFQQINFYADDFLINYFI